MDIDVFISYSRKDSAIADEICTILDDAGISYFIDRKGISGGVDFVKEISSSIMNSKIILFLGSANSYQSEYTQKEITFAQNEKKNIIPYIIDDTALPKELKLLFANLNIRNYKDYPPQSALVYDILSQLGKKHIIEQLKNKKQAEDLYALGRNHLARKEFDSAFLLFVQSAKLNNSDAQYEISQLYKNGLGVSKDEKLSYKWLLESESNGNARAQYALCMLYLAEQRKELAKTFCYKAAIQGFAKAEFVLSSIFSSGNDQEDIEWLKKAATHGHPEAQFKYGNHFLSGKSHNEALHWMLSASKQGVVEAMKSAADILCDGIGVNEDKEHAYRLYIEAAKKGNKESQFIVAEQAYHNKQYKEARFWYQKCDEGVESKYKLGLLYENGLGTEKNNAKAESYYKKAAKSGHFKAQIKLCQILDEKGNKKEAFHWWKIAFANIKNNCNTETARICIDCFSKSSFYNDNNCKSDYHELLKYIFTFALTLNDSKEQKTLCQLVAEKGYVDAQYKLGIMSKEPKEALLWLEMSATQGHIDSMFELGKLLCTEESVKNRHKGESWLDSAARQGHVFAQFFLGKILIEENIEEYGNAETPLEQYAIKLLNEAEKKGNSQAAFVLGKLYREKGIDGRRNYIEKKDLLLQAEQHLKLALTADVENTEATYLLGLTYDELLRHDEAKRMFLKAANKGHTEAMLELHDDTWTLQAANMGNVAAMYRLGCDLTHCKDIGIAVDRYADHQKAISDELMFVVNFKEKYGREPKDNEIPDFEKPLKEKRFKKAEGGLSWMLKGAKLNSLECIETLGDIYKKGDIVNKDLNQAINWYKKVIELSPDQKECICKIGDCYYEMGNLYEALCYYKEAVKKGYNKGYIRSVLPLPHEMPYNKTDNPKYLIPEIYETLNDYNSAIRLYTEYAESGEKAAQERLGWMYEKGIAVKQDYSKALEWYNKAGSDRANRLKGISGLIVKLLKL